MPKTPEEIEKLLESLGAQLLTLSEKLGVLEKTDKYSPKIGELEVKIKELENYRDKLSETRGSKSNMFLPHTWFD